MESASSPASALLVLVNLQLFYALLLPAKEAEGGRGRQWCIQCLGWANNGTPTRPLTAAGSAVYVCVIVFACVCVCHSAGQGTVHAINNRTQTKRKAQQAA